MKKPYQIAAGRALQRVRQWAEEKHPVVQLLLPMVEILTLAKRGAGELVREAGLRIMLLAIQQEAESRRALGINAPLVGKRSAGAERTVPSCMNIRLTFGALGRHFRKGNSLSKGLKGGMSLSILRQRRA